MQETFSKAVEAFITNNIDGIKKFAGWFAKSITINLMNDNKEQLHKLCKDATYMRSDIEFTEPIKMTKDYYLGYCSAYENVARKLLEEEDGQENIELVINQLPNLRMQKIINFLGKQGYAQQNKLANYLEISPSHLWNILNNNSVKELDIFSVRKIGKHAIYGLNKKGKQYLKGKIANDKKQYSKDQIIELLSLIIKNYDTSEVKDLTEKAKILDEELVKVFYEMFYEFSISNKWGSKVQTTYSIDYKSMIQEEIIKRNDKISINYQFEQLNSGQVDNKSTKDDNDKLEFAA